MIYKQKLKIFIFWTTNIYKAMFGHKSDLILNYYSEKNANTFFSKHTKFSELSAGHSFI